MDILSEILPFVIAILLGVLGYQLVTSIKIEKPTTQRVGDFMESKKVSAMDKYGDSLTSRLGLDLKTWKLHLRWAQLGGHYHGWSVGGILLRCLVYGGVVAVYIFLMEAAPFYWLGVLIAGYFPLMRVKSRADETRKELSRLLPELVTVLAAEMDAGSGPETALTRASEMPGPLGKLLQEAIAESRRSNLPMFSRGSAQGVVMEKLAEANLAAMNRFASRLDMVAGKGVEAARIMGEVARGFAREYKSQVTRAAANLDSTLLFPMVLLFFVPFIFAMMLPLFLSLFAAFE